jgi:hypothetical protein
MPLIKFVVHLIYWAWIAHKGREDEEENLNSYWITLRKREVDVN